MNVTRTAGAIWLVFCAACFRPLIPGPDGLLRPDTLKGGNPPGRGVSAPVVSKKVAEKAAPATLYSGDGYHCQVNPARFAEVKIGDNVLCPWTK